MLRLLLIPAVLLALLGGAMIWSGGSTVRQADFTFVNRGEVTTLDPNRISWMQDFRIAYALWEGLYALDPVTLQAIPGCADPIDINPEKTVYTFHIRRDARWSNGDDVQCKDFLFAWRRMLEEPGEYTYLLHYIKGAKAYEDAFATFLKKYDAALTQFLKDGNKDAFDRFFQEVSPSLDFSTVGIKELGPKTLQITLDHPCPPFPDICTMPPFLPLNERSMEKFLDRRALEQSHGRVRRYNKEFTRPPDLVSNGPYQLSSWEFKRRMRMTANPYYWDIANVKSKIIDQVSADDPQWGFAMYESGGVNWIAEFTGDIAAELVARHRSDVHVFPAFGTYFYSFNCKPALSDGRPNPFFDVRVRQAFSMVLDKQVIVDKITRLGEIPTTTYIPRGAFPHYHSPAGLPMDIPAARKLLAEAGYPDGKGFPPVSLLFNNESVHGPVAENIRRQWVDKLGVDVRLEGIEIKMFRERLHNKDYAVARASWFGDYNDPSTFTDKYKPDSDNNDSGWANADYDALCKKADVEPDPQQRLHYFEQAEDILLKDAPILPIYTYVVCYLFRDNVTGIPLNPREMLVLKSVEVTH